MSTWNYAHDFHRCHRCGCTRAAKHLRACRRVDELLHLDDTVLVCADEARCSELKAMREAAT